MNTDYRTFVGERLREERERLGLRQPDMAAIGSAKARTYQDWERGIASVSAEFLSAVADRGLDVAYVITGRRSLSGPAPAPASNDDSISVPRLAAVGSMGSGSALLVEDVIIGDVPFSRRWLRLHVPTSRPEGLRLLSSYGDSMQGTLNSGDFALVDTDCQVVDIDGIYVLQANDQLFIKRVTRKMDGRHEVTSDNPSVRTVDVLDGSQQVRICGRVVYGWNGRRL
ncbi:peptidase S24 [Acidovorax sp. GBBC 3334]|uniref:S24 family peptidase n=1 Tax=Acidovorax sp. GBBC 3334 TaxID=2940496 RepID=UPI00230290C8|nr:S24 family peptidase [Acidovorax sp. GBBC 3334]MDA8455277.1 peptidase S24 [Acidovorax sp. GBBC 3334]